MEEGDDEWVCGLKAKAFKGFVSNPDEPEPDDNDTDADPDDDDDELKGDRALKLLGNGGGGGSGTEGRLNWWLKLSKSKIPPEDDDADAAAAAVDDDDDAKVGCRLKRDVNTSLYCLDCVSTAILAKSLLVPWSTHSLLSS